MNVFWELNPEGEIRFPILKNVIYAVNNYFLIFHQRAGPLILFIIESSVVQEFSQTLKHKYVVKHKSAKIFRMYAIGKLEAALNISQRVSYIVS